MGLDALVILNFELVSEKVDKDVHPPVGCYVILDQEGLPGVPVRLLLSLIDNVGNYFQKILDFFGGLVETKIEEKL